MKILFVFAATLLLSSCGPLPRPFIDQAPQNNPLLQLSGTRPLAVEPPVFNLPDTFADTEDQLSDLTLWAQDLLSEDMRKQGLPAAGYAPAENSLHITSSFSTSPGLLKATPQSTSTELKLDIVVREIASPNIEVITFSEQTRVPASLLQKSPKPIMRELIHRAAQKLSTEIVALDTTVPETSPSGITTLIALSPLPEIMNKPTQEVLTRELNTSLRLRGYTLVEAQNSNSQYTLRLKVRPFRKGDNFFLTLRWIVLEYATGEEVGVIEQTNSVPNIPLSRIIAPGSEAISEGTAQGIEDLLQQKSHQNQTVLK